MKDILLGFVDLISQNKDLGRQQMKRGTPCQTICSFPENITGTPGIVAPTAEVSFRLR